MRKFLALSLLVSLPALALSPPSGAGPYVFTGNLSAAEQAQLVARFQQLTAPPRVISTNPQDAANALLNEERAIKGMAGPLPQVLAAALERAAIRVPVQLLVTQTSEAARWSWKRVQARVVPGRADVTTLTTSNAVITVRGTQVWLLSAPLAASSVNALVDRTFNPNSKASPGGPR